MNSQNKISCIIVDDEAIAREVLTTHISKISNIDVLGTCSNAMEAFSYISNHQIDLVFLDINMPEISGISFAKSINKSIKIIFTTAYRDYAIEGFELRAVDYLLKPVSFERLLKAVNTYFDVHSKTSIQVENKNESQNFMFVRSERRMIKIDFSEIVYVESYSDYVKLHLKNNSTVVTRETISAIDGKLPKTDFIRIHRSFIVALMQIASFTNEEIVISNKSLPISRSYKKEVLSTLRKY